MVLGCAGGAEPSGGPISTGVGSAGPSTAAGSSDTGKDDTSPTTTDGDGDGESSSSGDAGESSSSSGDPSVADASSSSGGDDMPPPQCPNPVTCETAEVIGMVSGDEASDAIGISGADATWITFQVTEDNDAVVGESLSFTVTLSSPPGVDYDLYVYRGAPGGPTGCSGVLDSSTSASPTDVVHMSWGEAGVANGIDDRAWVAVEVVPKDTCPDGSQWTLDVDGDS